MSLWTIRPIVSGGVTSDWINCLSHNRLKDVRSREHYMPPVELEMHPDSVKKWSLFCLTMRGYDNQVLTCHYAGPEVGCHSLCSHYTPCILVNEHGPS